MPRIDDFFNALIIAREKVPSLDLKDLRRNVGPECSCLIQEKSLVLPYFGRRVTMSYPEGKVAYDDGNGEPSVQEQGLILHYLLGVKDIPCTGILITFREIPSGEFYYEPFLKRVQVPLLTSFGSNPELFRRTAAKFGGKEATFGDISMCFCPLPKIPITLVLWKGDEEFPPEATVLFDSSIISFLPAEDTVFLAGSLVYKLIAFART